MAIRRKLVNRGFGGAQNNISQTIINDLKITFVPAVHWPKRTLTDTDKTLWGSFLIEYKNKKYFLLVILVMEIFTKNLEKNMVLLI